MEKPSEQHVEGDRKATWQNTLHIQEHSMRIVLEAIQDLCWLLTTPGFDPWSYPCWLLQATTRPIHVYWPSGSL
jgi:hypothetical protein